MWLDRTSQTAIDDFWQRVGEIENFPRTLERAVAFALPVTLVKLPRLRLWDVEQYLKPRGICFHSIGTCARCMDVWLPMAARE
ncbi:MAG TPA: hypothetical protein VFD70_21890 [Anaerolineae bacterium]|nr:hypothetical protein [Anaerolineae bacterium]